MEAAPANSVMIEACNVRRFFDGDAVQSLRGLSMKVARGEFVSIMGPSGCGKSTLLNVLGGLDAGFQGEVTVNGVNLRTLAKPEQFRSRVIGFVFQSFHLLPTLTALENVQIPMFEMPWPAAERRRRAAELLGSLGLADRMNHLPSKLSGGERQRVAIARSLANEPQLLLADEPTGNLDSASARKILEVLAGIHRKAEMTIILVTHDPQVAALAGRILLMLDGEMVGEQPGATHVPS